jgi:hypothetical protein
MNKKLIYLLFSFLFIFLVTSCGQAADLADPIDIQEQETIAEITEESPEMIDEPEKTHLLNIVVDGIIDDNEYSNSYYDEPTGLRIFWNNDNTHLYIGVEATQDGWAAIGFDPEQAMKGANIIMIAMDEDTALIRDDFGDSPFTHKPDEDLGGSTDIIDFAGKNLEDGFMFEFVIPMDSGDEFDKKLESSNEYDMILAINSSSIDFDARHTNKSKTKILLD